MRLFGLTKLGKKTASSLVGDSEEVAAVRYLKDHKTASDTEMEGIGVERYILRRLKERGLVTELTT